jgi:hypothetical protein
MNSPSIRSVTVLCRDRHGCRSATAGLTAASVDAPALLITWAEAGANDKRRNEKRFGVLR